MMLVSPADIYIYFIHILFLFAACDVQSNQTDPSCSHNGKEALKFLGLDEVGRRYEVNNRPLYLNKA